MKFLAISLLGIQLAIVQPVGQLMCNIWVIKVPGSEILEGIGHGHTPPSPNGNDKYMEKDMGDPISFIMYQNPKYHTDLILFFSMSSWKPFFIWNSSQDNICIMFLEFVLEECYWFAIVAVYISSHITALALVTDGWHSVAEILRYSTSVDQLACNQMALSSIPAFLSTLSTFVQLQLSSCQHSRLTLLYCFPQHEWMGSKGNREGLNCPYLEDLTPCLVDQKSSRWQITESFACQLVCRLALALAGCRGGQPR